MVDSSGNQVAVFIDYQNLRNADWVRIMAEAEKLGRIVIKRAYADWTRHRSDHHALLSLGVDVEQVSSKRGKNAADIRIAIDAMDVLLDKRTTISHVFLVSGDGDFTDLVNRLKFYGKVVVGVGMKETTADYLREACDEYIFYDDLVQKKAQHANKPTRRPKLDVNVARNLLKQVLQARPTEWLSAGKVKRDMRQINTAFDESDYGFSGFLTFVNEMTEVAETRYAEGGHAEIRLRQTGEIKLEDARQLLMEAMQNNPEEWVLSAQLKQNMRRLRADFDEGDLGFKGFNAFLEAQTDLLAKQRDEGANLRVRLITDSLPTPAATDQATKETAVPEHADEVEEEDPDEALIDKYIRYLRQQRVHLTPSEHRARIVLKVYELFRKQPEGENLAHFQDVLVAHFAENHPQIPEKVVIEVLYQLFWAHCFEFDEDDSRYSPDTRLWQRRTTLANDVTSRARMLDKCDQYLLSKIAEKVDGAENVDLDVAMELLYGRIGNPQMKQHVEQLLTTDH